MSLCIWDDDNIVFMANEWMRCSRHGRREENLKKIRRDAGNGENENILRSGSEYRCMEYYIDTMCRLELIESNRMSSNVSLMFKENCENRCNSFIEFDIFTMDV